jgi:Type IV secretion-system coupling protein DNA-binding domain/TraM recognition site of TraD and TraG
MSPPLAPLAPLLAPLAWMVATFFHLVVGLLLGTLLAFALRLAGLRWTWAAALAPVAWLLRALAPLGGSSLTALSACAWAGVRGVALHRRDLRAGGDLARSAAMRLGPQEALSLARTWLDARRGTPPAKHAPDASRSAPLAAGRLEVGRGRGGAPVSIPFAGPGGGKHTLLVGATGSGKTVTEASIAVKAIEAGMGAIVVDPKGDAQLRDALADAAGAAGRRLLEWTPSGPTVYNPLGGGDPSSIADRALAGETFTEPHYLRQAQLYLLRAATSLRAAGETVCLRALVEQFDPERLRRTAAALPGEQAAQVSAYLDSLTARRLGELGGVRDRLAILAASSFAPWLDPATASAPAFDVAQAVRERAVVYFALQADSWPLLAQMLGGAIVADLVHSASELAGERIEAVVVLDEFSSLAAGQTASAFARAGDAGFNLVLATQELSDLRLPGREELASQVQGNLSALIVHRQVVPDSIDWLVRLAGEEGAWRASYDADGRWRATRACQPLLDAQTLRRLAPGQAVVVELGAGHGVRLASMHSPAEQPCTPPAA